MAMRKYQVAFSFASENRPYVKKVADHLQNSGVDVFYDSFEQVDLWGKDLYSHLDNIYRNRAHYCVIFISEAYGRKTWTNHERKSAQARAFEENQEYILPVRFDDTEIPGIHPTIGYVDLRSTQPQQLAEMIIQKLHRSSFLKDEQTQAILSSSKAQGKTKSAYSSRTQTKTVKFNQEGIGKLPNDCPVVYRILTETGSNNFTGAAKKGEVQERIREHLLSGRKHVPGSKVKIERMSSIESARAKAERIIARTKPKYNGRRK
ncbi:toll/interleukin-1 receptor domain-containing protein [Leptolyngbya sp. FACHB-261]|uniref:toll/interleukin-1 receptor domain-containing protein n=1 Tax=Leptolyngbya sp. FACHB-261 TaxID=2692806 RepID=UPI001687BF9A|nr:TIR domain-containing protein [Leptolyngbya sp. FACHB-261]MBD2104489.1 TIR domain-containing protein [Leptolyngbya sp. FACHB-261]